MQTLTDYANSNFLNEGNKEVLDKVRPAFLSLIARLNDLGGKSSGEERLSAFAEAFEVINHYEDEIETVERETILGAIYDIGEIVGLDRESEFAEEWRGDW